MKTLPAATLGSPHTCPAYEGDRPHQGGPVLAGSPTVFVERKMACRAGDPLQCNHAGPDTVLRGSASVFINGLPAARQHDPTAHGGRISGGAGSVFIG